MTPLDNANHMLSWSNSICITIRANVQNKSTKLLCHRRVRTLHVHSLEDKESRAGSSIGLTGCLGLHDKLSDFVLCVGEVSFRNPLSPTTPIPLRYLIRSTYSSPFSSVDSCPNEQKLLFLGFTCVLTPSLLFLRGIRREKENAILEWQSTTNCIGTR